MKRGSFFKFAQICLLFVEVNPNLMDKLAQIGAGVNAELIILLRLVKLAYSRPKDAFLPRMSEDQAQVLTGSQNTRKSSNLTKSAIAASNLLRQNQSSVMKFLVPSQKLKWMLKYCSYA